LQSEFGELVRSDQACKKSAEILDPIADPCFGDISTLYAGIESEALAAIDDIEDSQDLADRQISIALYRLAAFASLKAQTRRAADHGDAGSRLCAELAAAAPPRDCALLNVVGQYEVAEAFARGVQLLQLENDAAAVDAEQLVSGFCANFNSLSSKTAAAKQQPYLPATVVAYLDSQVASLKTSMDTLESRLVGNLDLADTPKAACDCINLDANDPGFTARCGRLPESTRSATFKAMCIRQNLRADQPTCPVL
jgi:hypothetical protein